MPSSIYQGVSVTLPSANTVFKLLTLVNAIAGYETLGRAEAVTLQNDPANAASNISVGDSGISATNRAAKLVTGQSMEIRAIGRGTSFIDAIYFRSDTAGVIVNVGILQN